MAEVIAPAQDGGEFRYKVNYEDQQIEEMSLDEATAYMQAFDASGFKQTTNWTQPSAGVRQLQRLDAALRRRRERGAVRRRRQRQ